MDIEDNIPHPPGFCTFWGDIAHLGGILRHFAIQNVQKMGGISHLYRLPES